MAKKSAASAKPKSATQAKSGVSAPQIVIAVVVGLALVAGIAFGVNYFLNKDNTTTPAAEDTSAADNATPDDGATDTSGLYTPEYKPNGKEVAVFDTSKGTIEVELNGKDAPLQVGNFIELAQDGYFDGTKFIRIEPIDPADPSTTIVQFGSPESRDATKEQVVEAATTTHEYQSGNSGRLIADELNDNTTIHSDGSLVAANTGAANTNGSMFYFSFGKQPGLDGRYTVFGETIKGLDNEHKLELGDTINSVTIKNAN